MIVAEKYGRVALGRIRAVGDRRTDANVDASHDRRGRADARIRTGDPFITNEVLYQLSYVGASGESRGGRAAPT